MSDEPTLQIKDIFGVTPVQPRDLFNLSDREDEILKMTWDGMTTAEMAIQVGIAKLDLSHSWRAHIQYALAVSANTQHTLRGNS